MVYSVLEEGRRRIIDNEDKRGKKDSHWERELLANFGGPVLVLCLCHPGFFLKEAFSIAV